MRTEKIMTWYHTALDWMLVHGWRILLIAAIVYILRRTAHKFIEKVVRKAVVSNRFLSPEAEKKREDTLIRIFSWVTSIAIILLGSLMILQEVGIPIGPILAGAGIVGLAVGFGGQYLIRDVISGFFIILENQYRIGDVVNLDGTGGFVEDISLRMTTMRDLDGTVIHIPHGEVKRVSNLTKDFSRVNINISLPYNTNLEHTITVVNRVGNDLAQDPRFKPFIKTPPQFLRVDSFGESSLAIKILGDTEPLKQWEVMGELRKRIKIAFDKEGIQFALPQRIVHTSTPLHPEKNQAND